MILLTGATGTVGSALLRRLTARGRARPLPGARPAPAGRPAGTRPDRPGRPRRPALVPQRAARGRHGGPPGGVDPRPAARVDRGAERRGHPAPGARRRAGGRARGSCSSRRWARATTRARASSGPRRWRSRPCESRGSRPSVFSPSIVYAPGRPLAHAARALLATCRRSRYRARADALYQPIWAEDVADCVMAALAADGSGHRATSSPAPRRSPTTRSCAWRCAPTGRRRRLAARAAARGARLAAGRSAGWSARGRSPPGRRPS